MYTAPRVENISSFVRNPNTFIEALAEGPIHFTQRGKEAGVMISPDEWRQIVARLARL
ncbi:type II toxin-antitoxin system Phd/YefM family antitoxin [Chloroflexi bacterium TSY]|nr:type II toxin-antitoxin system Phd/YefM family antitoxin [Chloroflexi bacterium TSY]